MNYFLIALAVSIGWHIGSYLVEAVGTPLLKRWGKTDLCDKIVNGRSINTSSSSNSVKMKIGF